MSEEYALEIHDIHKSFRLPRERASGVKSALINRLRGIKGYKDQKVLRGVDFKVKKGEFLGIVGRNGSGKSTLLKIISEIYQPSSGKVVVNGKLVPFIELGVGFNPELTGRENVYLNGALLGFSNNEIDDMYNDIVDFAELHDFMEQKLKNYSSGMQVRLAFSVAIQAKSDILVLDEVLAVGDEAFQRKCNSYFAQVRKEGRTVVLVTHSMDAVQQFCTSAILIEDGKITRSGNPAKVAQRYRELNSMLRTKDGGQELSYNNESVDVKTSYTKTFDKITFDIKVIPKYSLEDPVVAVTINRDTGEMVYVWTSDFRLGKAIELDVGKPFSLKLDLDNVFPDGVYDVQIAIKKADRTGDYAVFDHAIEFEVDNNYRHWRIRDGYSYHGPKRDKKTS